MQPAMSTSIAFGLVRSAFIKIFMLFYFFMPFSLIFILFMHYMITANTPQARWGFLSSLQ